MQLLILINLILIKRRSLLRFKASLWLRRGHDWKPDAGTER